MHDRDADLENAYELKFSQEQGFFDRSIVLKAFIALFFIFSLFLFLHFREVRVETLELNSIAPSYIVAQTDFDFFDEEATTIMRQEAVREIGKIYQISEQEIRERRIQFENLLIYNQEEWRKHLENSTFEEMNNGVTAVEKLMIQLRFTDARTYQKIKELGLSVEHYLNYTPPDLSQPVFLSQNIWKYITKRALPGDKFHLATSIFIIGFFQKENWIIEEDIPIQRKLRQYIQRQVPDKYTHITAGSRIINQGDRVTARQLAMLQSMKKTLSDARNLKHPLTLLGSFILASLSAILCYYYLLNSYPQILKSNRSLALITTIIALTLLIAKIVEHFLLNGSFSEMVRYPVLIPFAAILLCSLTNSNIATFVSGFLSVLMTLVLSFPSPSFLIVNLSTALVAILSAKSFQRRKEIFIICIKAWVVCAIVIFAMQFSQNIFWNSKMLPNLFSTAMFMLITGIAVIGLLPLLESIFRVMTDVTLTEYMDPNNDVLRRLTIDAPGTYQHSIVVGNIAEAAAVAIGANGLFCRVATLYHDIGKMATPQYFTENQGEGMNIHQLLTPQESAAVIIAHVSEGVSIARKAGLPEPFIDIIKEHHGTSLAYYFYRQQLEKMGGDKSKVNEAEFRYAGPKPRSKESGIIMISDTLEAASRSLEKIDEKSLTELAHRLVREKMEDGQLDYCLLTLEELATICSVIVKTIEAFGHTRIKYPARDLISTVGRPNIEA